MKKPISAMESSPVVRAAATLLACIAFPICTKAQTGSLVFKSGFEGSTSLGTPQNCSIGPTACWQFISGIDGSYIWPPQVWNTHNAYGDGGLFQLIADLPGVNDTNIEQVLFNRIVTIRGRTGEWQNRALFSQVTVTENGQNQMEGGATQLGFNLFPSASQGDTYISYWLRFPPGVTSTMYGLDPTKIGAYPNGGTWRAFFALKSGTVAGLNDIPPNDGDFRIEAYILTGCPPELLNSGFSPCNGTNPNPAAFWMVRADSNAGGAFPATTYWVEASNAEPPRDDASWQKVEVFWRRSSGPDGRFWMAINGTEIVDKMGPNMGAAGMPMNRIMPFILYSASYMPIFQWVDDIQIWTGGFPPPCTTEHWCNPPYASH